MEKINNINFYYQYGKNTLKSLKLILNNDITKKQLFVEIVILYKIDVYLILTNNIEIIKKEINKYIGKNEFIHILSYPIEFDKNKIYKQESKDFKPMGFWLSTLSPNIYTWFDKVIYEPFYGIPTIGLICKINMDKVLILNTLDKIIAFQEKYKTGKANYLGTYKKIHYLINYKKVKDDGYSSISFIPYIDECEFLWYKMLDVESICVLNTECIIKCNKIDINSIYDKFFPGLHIN